MVATGLFDFVSRVEKIVIDIPERIHFRSEITVLFLDGQSAAFRIRGVQRIDPVETDAAVIFQEIVDRKQRTFPVIIDRRIRAGSFIVDLAVIGGIAAGQQDLARTELDDAGFFLDRFVFTADPDHGLHCRGTFFLDDGQFRAGDQLDMILQFERPELGAFRGRLAQQDLSLGLAVLHQDHIAENRRTGQHEEPCTSDYFLFVHFLSFLIAKLYLKNQDIEPMVLPSTSGENNNSRPDCGVFRSRQYSALSRPSCRSGTGK